MNSLIVHQAARVRHEERLVRSLATQAQTKGTVVPRVNGSRA
jgi:hypothetical protein